MLYEVLVLFVYFVSLYLRYSSICFHRFAVVGSGNNSRKKAKMAGTTLLPSCGRRRANDKTFAVRRRQPVLCASKCLFDCEWNLCGGRRSDVPEAPCLMCTARVATGRWSEPTNSTAAVKRRQIYVHPRRPDPTHPTRA